MGTHAAVEVIQLENLTKAFGKLKAVDNLSLSIAPGEVLGFLGPNGAGKTTTMRMLVGLIKPTSGYASILGFDVAKRNPKMLARLGYLPGSLNLYENLTGHEFLSFVAKVRRQDCSQEIANLADRLDLDLHKHLHDLSKGNRQKVGVVAAFMHQPDVLILDEPTSGLDPLMQREFEGMLAEAKARGAATLLSSHVMSEVENLSDRVAIIEHGRLRMLDRVTSLKEKSLHRLEFTFDHAVAETEFANIDGVRETHAVGNKLLLEVTGSEAAVLAKAAALGAIGVRSEEPSLDEIFLGLIGNGGAK